MMGGTGGGLGIPHFICFGICEVSGFDRLDVSRGRGVSFSGGRWGWAMDTVVTLMRCCCYCAEYFSCLFVALLPFGWYETRDLRTCISNAILDQRGIQTIPS